MAVYDLRCRACGHDFTLEAEGPVKESLKKCPECGSVDLQQKALSYLRNGPWSTAGCYVPRGSGFG